MLWKYYFLFSILFLIWTSFLTATSKRQHEINIAKLNKILNKRLGESPVKTKCINDKFWDHNDFKWSKEVLDIVSNRDEHHELIPENTTLATLSLCYDDECTRNLKADCFWFLWELTTQTYVLTSEKLDEYIYHTEKKEPTNPANIIIIIIITIAVVSVCNYCAQAIKLNEIIDKLCTEHASYYYIIMFCFMVALSLSVYIGDQWYCLVIWGAIMASVFGTITNYFIVKDLFIHIFVKENIPKQIVLVNYELLLKDDIA